jgi:hypothetical protein
MPSGRSECWCMDTMISKTLRTWLPDSCGSRRQLRIGSSVRGFPAAPTPRVVVAISCHFPRRDQPPCRPIVHLPPGDVACRRSSLLVSALPWCRSPTSLTPGTDIICESEKTPSYMAFRRQLILRIAAASPSRSSACDRPPACAMSCLTPGKV